MVIPKDHLTHFQRWEAGSFDHQAPAPEPGPAPGGTPDTLPPTEAGETVANFSLPTADDIERIHEEARAAGFQAGHAEGLRSGLQAAETEAQAQAAQLRHLLDNATTALATLDDTVGRQLLDLAIDIAAQVTRSAITVKHDILMPLIREAIAALPLHHGHVALRLNPADLARVRSLMGEQFAQTGTQLIEDSAVSPGGCLLQAGTSEVDASIETRWRRVIETIDTEAREWLTP